MKQIWKRKALPMILTLIAQARWVVLPPPLFEMSNAKKPKDVIALEPLPGTERYKGGHIRVARERYIHFQISKCPTGIS